MNIIIDPEFKALIPDLTPDEYNQLQDNILTDGVLSPLTVWAEEGILLDGHNRKEIADLYGKEYLTIELSFPDRAAAITWIIRNQLGRRNLTDAQRVVLALKLKPALEAQARDRMLSGKAPDPSEKSPQGTVRQQIADAAGVSDNTVAKVERVLRDAVPEVQTAVLAGEVSINAGAAVADLPRELQQEAAAGGADAIKTAAKNPAKKKQAKRGSQHLALVLAEEAIAILNHPWNRISPPELKDKINELYAVLQRMLGDETYSKITQARGARGVGLDWAHRALGAIKNIPPCDPLREEALDLVISNCKHWKKAEGQL